MIRRIIGVVLIVVGAVWIAQGTGALGGSFMSGEALWTVIGIIVVLFGGALFIGSIRDGRRTDDER
jgi:hypothetical protein